MNVNSVLKMGSLPFIPCRCLLTESVHLGRPSDGSVVTIDRSGLMGESFVKPRPPARLPDLRPFESSTPLCDLIKGMIHSRGPVSVAEFMKLCLSHPVLGYYMHKEHAVFGTAGDFITSPEISQMFGELVALWLISTWQQLGCPPSVALIECGPGRGTLMADILRVARKIAPFAAAVSRVDLVETSASLRRVQAATLSVNNVVDCEPAEAGGAFAGRLSHGVISPDGALPGVRVVWHDRIEETARSSSGSSGADVWAMSAPAPAASPTAAAERAPAGTTAALSPAPVALIVAHELFDALPVHQLEWVPPHGHGHGQEQSNSAAAIAGTTSGSSSGSASGSVGASVSSVPLSGPGMWRERLVDVDPDAPVEAPAAAVATASTSAGGPATNAAAPAVAAVADQRQHFVVVTAPGATPASATFSALVDSLHRRATASSASSTVALGAAMGIGGPASAAQPPAASAAEGQAVTDEMLLAFLRAEQEMLAAKAKAKVAGATAAGAASNQMSNAAVDAASAAAGSSSAPGVASSTPPAIAAAGAAVAPSLSPTHLRYGTVAEYCPSAAVVAAALAKRLSLAGGAALVVDYGYSHRAPLAGGDTSASAAHSAAEAAAVADGASTAAAAAGGSGAGEHQHHAAPAAVPRTPAHSAAEYLSPLPPLPAELRASVRAIRRHAFVPLTSMPGEADLSADVDFDALARVALEALVPASADAGSDAAPPSVARERGYGKASSALAAASLSSPLAVAGPVTQRDFLLQMGIGTRLMRLQQSLQQRQAAAEAAGDAATVASCNEQQARLQREAERLVYEMGGVYKFMAFLQLPPAGSDSGSVTLEAAAWKIASSSPGFA